MATRIVTTSIPSLPCCKWALTAEFLLCERVLLQQVYASPQKKDKEIPK